MSVALGSLLFKVAPLQCSTCLRPQPSICEPFGPQHCHVAAKQFDMGDFSQPPNPSEGCQHVKGLRHVP